MIRFATALLLALPLAGQAIAMGDAPAPPTEQAPAVPPPPAASAPDPSADLEAGVQNFMRNLLNEAQPGLNDLGNDLGGMVGSLGPVLSDLGTMIDDVRNYQAPERLENGDIIIRRRADAPPPPPVGPALRDMMRPAPDSPGQTPPDSPKADPTDTAVEL